MLPSNFLSEQNFSSETFILDGQICSVYTLKPAIKSESSPVIKKSSENLFAWSEIVADLRAGVGLDNDTAQAGRGGIFFFSGRQVPAPVVVRQYRHGGFWRFLSGARFFSPKRFLLELKTHQLAAAIGIPVPEAVAVIVVKKEQQPVFVNGYFVTFRLPESRTLPDFLRSAASRTRLHIFFKLGKFLRILHDNGIFYTDMHVKNVLVNSSGEPCLIDFDKSRNFEKPLSERLRRINLQRFLRSLEKYSSRGGRLIDSDRAAFLLAYASNSRRYAKLSQRLQRGLFWRRLIFRLGWLINRS